MFDYLPNAALIVFLFISAVFILALILKDNSIVDTFWGIGFILLTITSLWQSGAVEPKMIIVSSVVFIWGLRLSLHIFLRNAGNGEDFRYANWRRSWKHFRLRSFLQIFMLQGFFMLIIAWPVLHVNAKAGSGFGMIDILGLIVFFTGFFFEAVGDYQLLKFKSDTENKGRIITSGLWKYSRHPNYFGEALLWWGIWIMAIPVNDGIFTILSPLTITLLLRYISGVPMLEKKYEGRPDWEAYKERTPVFVPFLKLPA